MKIRPRSRRRSCTGGLPKDPVIRRGRRDTRRTRRPNSTCRHEQPETATARNIPAFPCGASRTIGTVVMVGSSNMLQAPVNPVPGAAPGGSATAAPAIAIMRIALLTIVRMTRFIRFSPLFICADISEGGSPKRSTSIASSLVVRLGVCAHVDGSVVTSGPISRVIFVTRR